MRRPSHKSIITNQRQWLTSPHQFWIYILRLHVSLIFEDDSLSNDLGSFQYPAAGPLRALYAFILGGAGACLTHLFAGRTLP